LQDVEEYLSGKSGGFEILRKRYGVPLMTLERGVHLYELMEVKAFSELEEHILWNLKSVS